MDLKDMDKNLYTRAQYGGNGQNQVEIQSTQVGPATDNFSICAHLCKRIEVQLCWRHQ